MDYYSLKKDENKAAFRRGFSAGIPIGLGYFAVAFSLGIAARNAGLTAFQSALTSLLVNASAGEYAGFTLIKEGAAYLEMAIMIFIANIRYILMSFAMSQRMKPGVKLRHRLIMGFDITDELFAIAIAKEGYLNPNYTYGAMAVSMPMWALGTAFGCIAGNLLPGRLVSAFSVALYGMFLAVIIPPARKNPIIAVLIVICFVLSFACNYIPFVNSLSSGTRTIILTVLIASVFAILFPRKEEADES